MIINKSAWFVESFVLRIHVLFFNTKIDEEQLQKAEGSMETKISASFLNQECHNLISSYITCISLFHHNYAALTLMQAFIKKKLLNKFRHLKCVLSAGLVEKILTPSPWTTPTSYPYELPFELTMVGHEVTTSKINQKIVHMGGPLGTTQFKIFLREGVPLIGLL